jgi:hypothetical protein
MLLQTGRENNYNMVLVYGTAETILSQIWGVTLDGVWIDESIY